MAPSEVPCDGEVEEISRVRLSIWRLNDALYAYAVYSISDYLKRCSSARCFVPSLCKSFKYAKILLDINNSGIRDIPFTLKLYIDENNAEFLFLKQLKITVRMLSKFVTNELNCN